jgi:hypothetical protein
MRTQLLLILLISANIASCQSVKESELIGLWTTCNDDSLYFKSDTLVLYQDINYRNLAKKQCCHYINWNIPTKKDFKIEDLFACAEPGTIKTSGLKEKIKLITKNSEKIIEIYTNGSVTDRFIILKFESKEVDRYPWEIKILTIKRL